MALVDATYPRTFSVYRSAWDNRDGEVFAHVPNKARQKYAEFYDELANNEANFVRDREAWAALVPYEQAGSLSIDDRRKLHLAARTVAFLNTIQHGNFEGTREIGRALGIGPREPDSFTLEDMREVRTCRTLARPPASRTAA